MTLWPATVRIRLLLLTSYLTPVKVIIFSITLLFSWLFYLLLRRQPETLYKLDRKPEGRKAGPTTNLGGGGRNRNQTESFLTTL